MIEIILASIPNQSLSVQLSGFIWDITLKEAKGIMAASIVRDNVPIISNMRLVPGVPLLPYQYQEEGNFWFVTNNGDYPYYTEFGKTQSLFYVSQAELEVIRGT